MTYDSQDNQFYWGITEQGYPFSACPTGKKTRQTKELNHMAEWFAPVLNRMIVISLVNSLADGRNDGVAKTATVVRLLIEDVHKCW